MHLTRNRILLSTIVIALAACGERSPRNAPATSSAAVSARTKVKLVLNWVPEPEFGGIYAARGNGAFAKNGLDVEISGGGEAVLKLLAAGKVEFGVVSADEIVIARAQGIDVVGLFATYQTNPQGLMVRASRNFHEIGEIFRNPGTVAMQPGLAYKDFLKKRFGFDKVKVVPYDFTVQRFLVETDYAQQCFVTAEPIAANRAGVEPKLFLIAEAGYNPYTAVIATRGELMRTKPELVRSMLAALGSGWRAYLDDPSTTNAVMAKLNTNLDAETFRLAAEAQKPLIETAETAKLGLGCMTAERWDALARQLLELGVVAKSVPGSDCFVVAGAAPKH